MSKQPRAGRKPKSETGEAASSFTTRLAPELRRALEKEAKERGVSMSQVVDEHLRNGLEIPQRLRFYFRALADLVDEVEHATGMQFERDRYTAIAIATAIRKLLLGLSPYRTPTPPASMAEYVDWHLKEMERMLRTSGRFSANQRDLIDQALASRRSSFDDPDTFGEALAYHLVMEFETEIRKRTPFGKYLVGAAPHLAKRANFRDRVSSLTKQRRSLFK